MTLRCAECDCEKGGDDCNWIWVPQKEMDEARKQVEEWEFKEKVRLAVADAVKKCGMEVMRKAFGGQKGK